MRNPIFVALDVPSAGDAWSLVERLSPVVGGFKVGSELFTLAGPEMVRRIRGRGASVFLDLKFNDIPNTVARAVRAATELGVQMLTVHTSGGAEMLKAAERSAQETARSSGSAAPLVLGVTVLTSMETKALGEVGVSGTVAEQVRRLALLGAAAGLRGFVCSPLEVAELRSILPEGTELVTPGIRSGREQSDDQKRTLSAREALAAGATWLVIGRPICAAADPVAAAEELVRSLE